MIFSLESISEQLDLLIDSYPELHVVKSDEQCVQLHGKIFVYRTICEFTLRKNYEIDILIPLNSDELPSIIDNNDQISSSYHHRYKDGKLCIDTDTMMRIRFINGFNLVEWMTDFVEPYFVYYEYYQIYGTFPLGEHEHGCIGTLETYRDLFHTTSVPNALKIMKYVKDSFYDGHHSCPCGSKKYIRKCHGKWILPFYNDKRLKNILINDLNAIYEELNNYDTN